MPMTMKGFLKAQLTDLPILLTPEACSGRVYIITGSNSGIGREAVAHLVRMGASRVIMGVRSPSRGATALSSIEAETGVRGVAEVWPLDMSDMESVRAFAARAARDLLPHRLDALVLNATAALDSYTTVTDPVLGVMETTVATNVVGTFLLMLLMLPQLRACSARLRTTMPHVVVLSSGLAFEHPEIMDLAAKGDVFDMLNDPLGPSGMKARYGVSKLVQLLAMLWLTTTAAPPKVGGSDGRGDSRPLLPVERSGADDADGHGGAAAGAVVVNLLSPGLCNTGMVRHSRTSYRALVASVNMVIGRSPEMGSRTILHALAAGRESHGRYLSDCEIKDHWVPDWVMNERAKGIQERVWKQLASRLEAIEPGVVARGLGLGRS